MKNQQNVQNVRVAKGGGLRGPSRSSATCVSWTLSSSTPRGAPHRHYPCVWARDWANDPASPACSAGRCRANMAHIRKSGRCCQLLRGSRPPHLSDNVRAHQPELLPPDLPCPLGSARTGPCFAVLQGLQRARGVSRRHRLLRQSHAPESISAEHGGWGRGVVQAGVHTTPPTHFPQGRRVIRGQRAGSNDEMMKKVTQSSLIACRKMQQGTPCSVLWSRGSRRRITWRAWSCAQRAHSGRLHVEQ